MSVRPRGNGYQLSKNHNGQRCIVTAAQWAAKRGWATSVFNSKSIIALHADFDNQVSLGKFADIMAIGSCPAGTVDTFLDDYVKLHVTPNGVTSVLTDVAIVRKAFAGTLLSELAKPATVLKYKADLLERKKAPATVNKRLARLKHMLRWAVQMGYLTEQKAFSSVKGAKLVSFELVNNKRDRRITPSEEKALRGAMDDAVMEGRFLAALYCGLRRGEMQAAQRQHLDYTKWELTLPWGNTKSGKTRKVPIEHGELKMFLNTRRFLEGDTFLFGGPKGEFVADFKTQWIAIVKSAYPGKTFKAIDLKWHDTRHEYATRLMEAGVLVTEVQHLLGHSAIMTTMRYYNQDFENLRASVRRVQGGA